MKGENMKTRAEIKTEAKAILSTSYGTVLGNMVLYIILSGFAGATLIGSILINPPMTVGLMEGIKLLWRGETAVSIFEGFKEDKFGRSIGGIVLMVIFVFLWSLLFVIPGIVMGFAYSMTPFLISDTKGLTAGQTLQLSKKLTNGYKGELFVFMLSYLGWMLLSSLTFGLLYIFYVGPYMLVSFGGYYEELKRRALENGVVTEADFGV